MLQDRQATTLRTDRAVLAEVDRVAHSMGLSRNDVLNQLMKVAAETGIETMIALAASGQKVEREAQVG